MWCLFHKSNSLKNVICCINSLLLVLVNIFCWCGNSKDQQFLFYKTSIKPRIIRQSFFFWQSLQSPNTKYFVDGLNQNGCVWKEHTRLHVEKKQHIKSTSGQQRIGVAMGQQSIEVNQQQNGFNGRKYALWSGPVLNSAWLRCCFMTLRERFTPDIPIKIAEPKKFCTEELSKILPSCCAGLICIYRKYLVEVIAAKLGSTSYYIQRFTYFFHPALCLQASRCNGEMKVLC